MTSPDIRERAERLQLQLLKLAVLGDDGVDLISQALTAEREAGRAEERERAAAALEAELSANDDIGEFHDGAKAAIRSALTAIRNPET